MAPADFDGLVNPSRTQHRGQADILSFFLKDAFRFHTILLMGAVIQIVLFATLPDRFAILPALLVCLYVAIKTAVQCVNGPRDTYMDGVLLGRTSAQLPSAENGQFGSQPAAYPIVVFHFGVRFNHPLGVLAPGAKKMIDYFNACNTQVSERADDFGMLGMSPWRAGERGSNNTLMIVYYFRDIDGLNRFAHGDVHRKAWDWINKAGYKHIGFFHEAFCVPPEAYESIYVNFQPLLMGATSVRCMDKEGNESWIRPVVNADVGPLRSQFSRMGRAVRENVDL